MNQRFNHLTLLVLLGSLAACSSVSPSQESGEPTAHFNPAKDPYWTDPRWDKTMLDSTQVAVHDPVDPTDTSAPGLHATVKFTYFDGTIEYPEIVQGTGNADLDKLMLQQLASAQIPKPTAGLQTDSPHEFVIDLDMPTPFESFQSSIYGVIDYQKIYPKDAIIGAKVGTTVIDFDYADGKANNITMVKSSREKLLDQASLHTVQRAIMPTAPTAYAGKTLHMEVLVCYSLVESPTDIKNPCPVAKNVILVQGTRIVRVDTYRM